MKISIYKDGVSNVENFPKPVLELQDILDRQHNRHDNACVQFCFPHDRDTLLPSAMLDELFYMDIYRLNFLIEQYEQMSPGQRVAFVAVADNIKAEHPDDLIPLTFNLISVPTIAARNYSELGQFCIENEMLPEVESCPEDVLPYLDRERIGMLMAERNHGVLLGGCYCEPEQYECRNVAVEINRPQGEFFRLRIGAPCDEQNAQWFSFPCKFEDIWNFSDRCGLDSEELVCYEMQSAIPRFVFDDMEVLQDLNEVAWQLHNLSPENVTKVKAVMSAEDSCGIAGLQAALRTRDEYQFEVVDDYSHYALRYLRANLPEGFHISALSGTDLYDLGVTVLGAKKGSMTEYGVLIRGGDLYSMLPKPEWMQEESESEDESEDCQLKWGDMT